MAKAKKAKVSKVSKGANKAGAKAKQGSASSKAKGSASGPTQTLKKAAPKATEKKAAQKKAAPKTSTKGKSKVAPKPATKTATKPATKPATKTAKKAAPLKPVSKTGTTKGSATTTKVAKKTSTGKAAGASSAKVLPFERSKGSKEPKKPSVVVASLFTPLDDRVVIERAGQADRTPGGLFIPDTVTSVERPNQGKVVATGRGHLDKKGRVRPLDVQVGDLVMFAPYSGSEISLNGSEFLVLRENEIIAVMKG